jgi:hypothetical protein
MIDADRPGSGLYRNLLRTLERRAQHHGFDVLVIDNAVPSTPYHTPNVGRVDEARIQKFYDAMGYQRVPARETMWNLGAVDISYFRRLE